MSEAYRHGIKKMWILNVGDIKPAEYQTELFMDMAWDFDAVARGAYRSICGRSRPRIRTGNSGGDTADNGRSLPPLRIRRPEFMGNTRTENAIANAGTQ